ncbi:MAG: PASTA domain-containing protein [Actinobacteria bacterium]|nr:PASTA domain-containing protein [Actinomycetota bacterium]MCG2819284.1 PASTA domain-containing protein [Actinomycetes bacterium]MBU4218083.1 PASTA domain-containing protein [Actinomycetota bacterium]MBU4360199.1 PASTA domain-containing protein [Actinomycetota bacterium]MBU4393201.1 PASTA domain-containing protein [Actinomycetota bacterium]
MDHKGQIVFSTETPGRRAAITHRLASLTAACSIVLVLVAGLLTGGCITFKKQVPDVVGLTEERARARLEGAGFKFSAEYKADDKAEKGEVVEQSPEAGTRAEKDSTVAVLVAVSGKVEVPDLVGIPRDQALALLKKNLLKSNIQQQTVEEQARNEIILSQDPAPGTMLDAGAEVALVVGVYQDGEIEEEIEEGERVKKTRRVTCQTCGGSGVISENYTEQETVACPTCGGKGAIAGPNGMEICPTCGGSGTITQTVTKTRQVTCPTCGGTGYVIEEYWVYE